jgi:hypothetical protein
MRFKPIFTDEELNRAEEEIAEAARNFGQAEVNTAPVSSRDKAGNVSKIVEEVSITTKTEDISSLIAVAPEPNITGMTMPSVTKLAALVGVKTKHWRKIDAVNRFVRTIQFGLKKGLYNPSRREGGREYMMCMKLYAEVKRPATSHDDVLLALGWAQALIAVSCEGVSPATVRALK